MRRLLLVRTADPDAQAFALGWSRFRRAQQAVAQRGHSARRERERQGLPSPAAPALGRPAQCPRCHQRLAPLLADGMGPAAVRLTLPVAVMRPLCDPFAHWCYPAAGVFCAHVAGADA